MAKYFAGNSLAAFYRTTTLIAESTTAGTFDSTYVSNSINFNITDSSDYIETAHFSASPTSLWSRVDAKWTFGSNIDIWSVYNNTVGVFRIISTSTSNVKCQYWNGTAWTDTGSVFSMGSTLATYVLKIQLGVGFELYKNNTLIASSSGWTGTLQTTVTHERFKNTNSSEAYISQVMIADYDIRDSHYMSAALNGNSAVNTGGTGSYTDVNETVLNETTAVVINATGNQHGQTKAAITVPSGYIIGGMVITGRGRVNGAITNGKFGVRSGGGVESSGSNLNFTGGYEPRYRIIETDPDTATNFTQTGFNNAEIYEEAV